jgi:hypothetical protein
MEVSQCCPGAWGPGWNSNLPTHAYIQEWRGNAALGKPYDAKAQEVQSLVNNKWWNDKDQSFYTRVNANHELEGRGSSVLLYHEVIEGGPKLEAAVKELEGGRNSAEILYKYGKDDEALAQMLEVVFGPRSRREYPETSFTWVGALVNGTTGISVVAPRPAQAWVAGYWTDALLRTSPGLGSKLAWAEIRNLPIRANEVAVRHDGVRKTTVINQKGPAFMWQATFAGEHPTLLVNGQPAKATIVSKASAMPSSAAVPAVASDTGFGDLHAFLWTPNAPWHVRRPRLP